MPVIGHKGYDGETLTSKQLFRFCELIAFIRIITKAANTTPQYPRVREFASFKRVLFFHVKHINPQSSLQPLQMYSNDLRKKMSGK